MLWWFVTMAHAHESIPQTFLLTDWVEVFEASEVDSGWIPADGMLSVRLQVVANGGLMLEMAGESGMSWPNDLGGVFTGWPETGIAALVSDISSVISLKFDIAGYTWEEAFTVSTITWW